MKTPRRAFSARYMTALSAHLRQNHGTNGDVAHGLGRRALAGGMSIVDVARLHERALVALTAAGEIAGLGSAAIGRAGHFLTQAIVPLETSQSRTRERNRLLQQRNATLRRNVSALATDTRRLKGEISRRKAGERALRRSREQYHQLFQESQVIQHQLRQLARQLISVQEKERRAISRELQEEVAQTLFGINARLSALGRGASVGVHTLKTGIADAQRLMTNSVNAVRRFASGLRPEVLDDLGLIPALHAYCRKLAARKRITIQLTAFRVVESLSPARRIVLYRVAQEALAAVVRHPEVTRVTVSIVELPDAVRMEIRNNGEAWPIHRAFRGRSSHRLGLIEMRERVEMVGGRLEIESAPAAGTVVRADMPFDRTPGRK